MSKLYLSLIAILLIGCGEKNKSSSHDDPGVPVITTSPVLAMANEYGDRTLLKDNYRLFRLELTKDFNFKLLQRMGQRRGLEIVLSGHWSVNGTHFNLDQIGSGHYAEVDFRGEKYSCLFLNANTISQRVKDIMGDVGIIDNNPQLKFCKILNNNPPL